MYKYSYRPFDCGYIYYDPKLLGRAREKTIYHLKKDNLALILVAQPQSANLNFFDCVYVTNSLTDTNIFRRGGPSCFPLYLYHEGLNQQLLEANITRVPNLNIDIVKEFEKRIKLTLSSQDGGANHSFSPIDVLDYNYAVLHSPFYREKYKEFLKTDFPTVPYPKDQITFWQLVKLGSELRKIHLLESPVVNNFITKYPIDGDNIVGKTKHKNGEVWINDTQYFSGVPLIAWDFYIGGYQPAQKWLKDRKGRVLSYEDIQHYQKIIVALTETNWIMNEIDKIEIE